MSARSDGNTEVPVVRIYWVVAVDICTVLETVDILYSSLLVVAVRKWVMSHNPVVSRGIVGNWGHVQL